MKVRYYAPGYRGMHAARNIKAGETIFFAPANFMITLERAKASPLNLMIQEAHILT